VRVTDVLAGAPEGGPEALNWSPEASSLPVIDGATRSHGAAGVNVRSDDMEAVAVDPGQHAVGSGKNTSYRVPAVYRALADKHPWPKLLGEVGAGSPGRESDEADPDSGLEGEDMHGELNAQRMRRVPRRAV
jgi:hypothetical protein